MDLGADFNDEALSEAGAILFTYVLSDGSHHVVPTPADSITIDGQNVAIAQPYIPNPGDMVYIFIQEGAFADVNGNTNAEYRMEVGGEDGWLISKGLTVDLVIGNYEATCVSYFDASVYVYNMTIEEDTEVENGVITVTGTFDGVWGRITIPSFQSLGDLIGDGSDVVIDAGYADETVPVIADVAVNGDITCTWGGLIVGGDNDGYYWDYYENTEWAKQSKRSSGPQQITPRILDLSRKTIIKAKE
jgi:hypothetical protein